MGQRLVEHNQFKIVGADLASQSALLQSDSLIYTSLDVTKWKDVSTVIKDHKPTWVFHMPAILSGAAEKGSLAMRRTLKVNVDSFVMMLKMAVRHQFRLFCPSTIAAFGPETPKTAPNTTIMAPRFLYGVTKVYNELLGEYFHRRYNVDYRALRLPGIIGSTASAGTGTTDYAIEMMRAAAEDVGHYKCYLRPDTRLPMAHIDDCIDGMIGFMSSPRSNLTTSVYNIQGMSFTPNELHQAIKTLGGKELTVDYVPDPRQAIADSWPDSMDDSLARRDWGWNPQHDLLSTVQSIINEIQRLERGKKASYGA